ncbi:MAG: CoA transferase [Dehalococcoidia bacterium]|nr:CoA transferase [Dehalococcoidia bacterium]
MPLPLEGVKVLEFTQRLYGPRAGVHLAEMGADSIKIEVPEGGDPIRGFMNPSYGGDLPRTGKLNYMFEMENHDKRSITLNLKNPQGQEIAHKLIKQSDVFLTNFQPDSLRRIKMDYDTLSQINPRLIYAIGSGWGIIGPDKDRPGYDFVGFAASGLMQTMGQPGSPPVCCRPGMGDHFTSVMLAYAIMVALYYREKSGVGQMVHVGLLAGLIEGGVAALASHLATGQEVERVDRRSADNAFWNFYEVKGGDWIQFAMPNSDQYWDAICRTLAIEQCRHDPRFDIQAHRRENTREFIQILDKAMLAHTRPEWEALLKPSGLVYGWVDSYAQLAKNPQVRANDWIVDFDHPTVGKVPIVGVLPQLSKTPGKIRKPSPGLGEHNQEIIQELGYSKADIAKFKENGVIG